MKHRALSMLLALVMVVSLLPVAALADVGEIREGSLVMRYGDGFGNEKTVPVGKYNVGLCLRKEEGNTVSRDWLTEADQSNLHFDGKVVKSISYSPEENQSDSENPLSWEIEVVESNGKNGYIQYGEDENNRVVVIVKQKQEGQGGEGQEGEPQLQMRFENTGVDTQHQMYSGTYNYIMFFGNGVLYGDMLGDNSNPEKGKLTYGGLVSHLEYTPIQNDNGEGEIPFWSITLAEPSGEETTGWIQYGTEESNRVTITVRPAPKPSGQLEVGYNGPFARELTLWAGTYDVELRLSGDNEIWRLNDAKYADQLHVDGSIIKSIEQHSFKDEEGNDVFVWTISVAEPSGEETTGWIQYGTEESNRVTITVLPSRGREVGENDTIYKQGSDEFDWANWGVVMPFEWHGKTYYLGTAAWSTKKPYAMGGRGVEEDEDYYAASVFSLMSGEVGSASASYQLREDIRAAMEKEGYRFELTLVPTDIGCAYYPAIRDVKMNITQQGDGTETTFTSEWQGQKFSKDSVGVWVYDARLIGPDEEQVERNLSNCKYSCNIPKEVVLKSKNVSAINREIENELKKFSEQENEGLYDNVVILVLPAGELEGQIVIPQTNAIVTVYGHDYGQGRIATTLKGGIRFDNNNTNHVGFIHFIGKGKNVEWVDKENEIRNEAVYGEGQGTPEVCLFEDYYIAIHSTDRPSWGSQDSVYINNNVAICQDGENGGQTIMRNNWFVGNNTAVVMKRSGSVDYLMSFKNRFINNEIDLSNESENVLWLSQNFFYHDFDGENGWRPILWEEKNGILVLNNNGGLLCDSSGKAPAFMDSNYNASKNDVKYLDFLPLFSTEGDSPKPMAYPLARTQDCSSFFYPNWGRDGENYPSYVLWGETISENDLNNLRCYSFDKQNNVVTGTLDFGASLAEAEN